MVAIPGIFKFFQSLLLQKEVAVHLFTAKYLFKINYMIH